METDVALQVKQGAPNLEDLNKLDEKSKIYHKEKQIDILIPNLYREIWILQGLG